MRKRMKEREKERKKYLEREREGKRRQRYRHSYLLTKEVTENKKTDRVNDKKSFLSNKIYDYFRVRCKSNKF